MKKLVNALIVFFIIFNVKFAVNAENILPEDFFDYLYFNSAKYMNEYYTSKEFKISKNNPYSEDIYSKNFYISNSNVYENTRIDAYEIDFNLFFKFRENPSYEMLNNLSKNKECSYRKIIKVDDNKIRSVLIDEYNYSFSEVESVIKIGKEHITDNQLEFLTLDNLTKILKENGINENVKYRALVGFDSISTIIYIETEQNIFFIPYTSKYVNVPLDTKKKEISRKDILDVENFKKIYAGEKGQVYFNNKVIQGDNLAVIYGDDYLIKASAYLELISKKKVVIKENEINFYKNEDSYKIIYSSDLKNIIYFKNEKELKDENELRYFKPIHFYILNNELYILDVEEGYFNFFYGNFLNEGKIVEYEIEVKNEKNN